MNLNEAVITISYEVGGIHYQRETFVSEPDQAIILRLTSSKSDALNFSFILDSPHISKSVTTSDDLANRGLISEERILKARKGIGGAAIEFAREAGANIVITGNIVYALSRSEISDVSGKLVTASINAKVLMPGSGKTVGIYNEQEKAIEALLSAMELKDTMEEDD